MVIKYRIFLTIIVADFFYIISNCEFQQTEHVFRLNINCYDMTTTPKRATKRLQQRTDMLIFLDSAHCRSRVMSDQVLRQHSQQDLPHLSHVPYWLYSKTVDMQISCSSDIQFYCMYSRPYFVVWRCHILECALMS